MHDIFNFTSPQGVSYWLSTLCYLCTYTHKHLYIRNYRHMAGLSTFEVLGKFDLSGLYILHVQ